MPIPPGTRVGPYEVVGAIGAGGMGEVYRARDNRLGRDVAIKVLPALFATVTERLQRFEREGGAQVSPDGKWIIFVSNELSQNEVFLQAYPAADRRLQVSSGGGIHPAWNPKGGEIFYRRADDMMSVKVTFGSSGPMLTSPGLATSQARVRASTP